MSLLTQSEKDEINSAMGQIFATFARAEKVKFYKPNVEEILIFDNDYNGDLSEYSNPNAVLTEQMAEFTCRVVFPSREKTWRNNLGGGANANLKFEQDLGLVYIQFLDEALDYIKDTIRFTFNGDKYQKDSSIRKIGVVDTFNVFQLSLKKVN